MDWAQIARPLAVTRPPSVVPAWLLGSLPVLVHLSGRVGADGWIPWALSWGIPVLGAPLLVLLSGRRRPASAIPVGLIVAAVLMLVLPDVGGQVAVVLVIGTLLWGVGLGIIGLAPSRLGAKRRMQPALLFVVSASVALVVSGFRQSIVLLLVAVMATIGAAAAPAVADRLVDAVVPPKGFVRSSARVVSAVVTRAAEWFGTLLKVVVMLPAACISVVMWFIHRLVGHDPLRSPAGPDTGWVVRRSDDPHPERFHSSARVHDARSTTAKASGVAVVCVTLVLLALPVALVLGASETRQHRETQHAVGAENPGPARGSGECGSAPEDPVLGGQPDYQTMSCERGRVLSNGTYRFPAGFELADHTGETINVNAGVRRTWAPPACDCRRLRVWWFGGSAAWGEGQRDLFTLPSMLAKAAWQQGIALDIENRAMPTWTLAQEVHLFASLRAMEPKPDLVVFYTGGNDLVFQGLRMLEGRPQDSSDMVLHERYLSDLFNDGIPLNPSEVDWSPDPASYEGTLSAEVARSLAEPAISRISRNAALASLLTEGSDIELSMFFQPLLAGSAPNAAPPEVVDLDLLAAFTEMMETARPLLPPTMHDVSAVYSEVQEPVFYDLFHTGETGAQIMAAELFERLSETLVALSQRETAE